jgi:tetratricopeptide (TPR) repeat protein
MSGTLIQSRPSPCGSERRSDTGRAIAVCGFLVLAVLIVFSRTLIQGFSKIDDPVLVFDEPHVSGGLSWSGIVWAFTNGPMGEWYPLSMLSHMLDCQLYGLHPAGHHFTNVLLHAATAVALFLVLRRMTEALWPSALVAALFALHPLHVESVAWVAERRDVLSGLFFMLTLGAYGEYVRHPRSLARYLAMIGLFALGLMAKPILVTLPPLLLLLDFWPLGRFGQGQPDAAGLGARSFPWRVVVEKLPLFALAIADAVVTMRTHNPWHAPITFPDRSANAAVSCVAYLGQLFVPVGLSPFYSHPEAGRPAWQVAAAAVLLLAITTAAVIGRRSYPFLFVGWFWYVGMLVPVLGLTYVGGEARADRYTYLSQIGLYLALVWGAMRLGASWPARRWVFGIGSALMLAALMACTWRQVGYWRDDKTLWEHAVACDPKSATAHYSLARILSETDEQAAVAHYWQALETGPNERKIYAMTRGIAHNALGDIATRKGDRSAAIDHFRQALEWDSDSVASVAAHMNLAGLLASQGDYDEAMLHFQRSVDLAPNDASVLWNLAAVLAQQGKTDDAIAAFRKALKIEPDSSATHSNLAALLAQRGDIDEAIVHFRRAIEIDPNVPFAYQQIAGLLRKQGKTSEAAKYDERGRKASLRYAKAQNLRGTELAQQSRIQEAIAEFQRAIATFPDYAEAHKNLADALARQGNIGGAITHYRQALAIDPNFAPARQRLEELSNR